MKVHAFFRRNEIPTINKILNAVNEDVESIGVIFKRTTFYKFLRAANFRYVSRNRNSKLTEREEIQCWRRNYLRKIKQYREEGRKIFYTDETWVNAGHTTSRIWCDMSIKSIRDSFIKGLTKGLINPTGRGERLICLHMGSEDGFLPRNTARVFQSKKTCDYHEEMNASVFEEWFREVLHLLPPNSVVVMDNASYHSRLKEQLPNTSWKKARIIEWLTNHGIHVDQSAIKAELLQQARQSKPKFRRYVVDSMAEEMGHTVLRLPPYHCELNPIELIWASMKQMVARNNKTFKMVDLKPLLEKSISDITPELWNNCVRHVRNKVEKEMWEVDYKSDDVYDRFINVAPMIIDIGPDDDSSEESGFGYEDTEYGDLSIDEYEVESENDLPINNATDFTDFSDLSQPLDDVPQDNSADYLPSITTNNEYVEVDIDWDE